MAVSDGLGYCNVQMDPATGEHAIGCLRNEPREGVSLEPCCVHRPRVKGVEIQDNQTLPTGDNGKVDARS